MAGTLINGVGQDRSFEKSAGSQITEDFDEESEVDSESQEPLKISKRGII